MVAVPGWQPHFFPRACPTCFSCCDILHPYLSGSSLPWMMPVGHQLSPEALPTCILMGLCALLEFWRRVRAQQGGAEGSVPGGCAKGRHSLSLLRVWSWWLCPGLCADHKNPEGCCDLASTVLGVPQLAVCGAARGAAGTLIFPLPLLSCAVPTFTAEVQRLSVRLLPFCFAFLLC